MKNGYSWCKNADEASIEAMKSALHEVMDPGIPLQSSFPRVSQQ